MNNGPRGPAQSAMLKGTDKTDVETGNSKEDMEPIMKKPKFKDDLKASSQAQAQAGWFLAMILAQVYLAMLLVTLVAVAIVYGKVKLVEAIEVSMASIQAPPGPGHP